MNRRDLLLQLSATGFVVGLPTLAAPAVAGAPFTLITDQPDPLTAALIIRIPSNAFLTPTWHVAVRVRSIRAALGAANAVLMMQSLRDLRASVQWVHRDGEVELIAATLPAERRIQKVRI